MNCTICGSNEVGLIHSGTRDSNDANIYRCDDCGIVFSYPQLGDDDYYISGEYRYERRDGNPELDYAKTIVEAKVRVEEISVGRKSRVLEIGGGAGAFASAIRYRVSNITVVEPFKVYRDYISDMGIECVPSIHDINGEYDMVVMFHVLEHMKDPIGFIRDISNRTGGKSMFYIEVPNHDDAMIGIFKNQSYIDYYYQKAHLYYFDSVTLSNVMSSAGVPCMSKYKQRYNIGNHMWWFTMNEPGGMGRYSELSNYTNYSYSRYLIDNKISDTLICIGRAL